MATFNMIKFILHIMKWPVYGGAVRDWCGGYVYEIQDIDVEKPENLDISSCGKGLNPKQNQTGAAKCLADPIVASLSAKGESRCKTSQTNFKKVGGIEMKTKRGRETGHGNTRSTEI